MPAAEPWADRSPTPYISPARGAQKSRCSCVLSGRKWLYITSAVQSLRQLRRKSRGIIETARASVHRPVTRAGCAVPDLLDVRQDPVELVQTVVTHHELALATAARLDGDAGAELLGELLLQALHVRVARGCPRTGSGTGRGLQAAHQRLGLAHRQALLRDQRSDLALLPFLGERQQRTGVAHLDRALLQQFAHLGRELQQAQQVADAHARAPDRIGGLLVRETELGDQARQRPRLLQGVEVLALDILDQRDGDGRLVGNVTYARRNLA